MRFLSQRGNAKLKQNRITFDTKVKIALTHRAQPSTPIKYHRLMRPKRFLALFMCTGAHALEKWQLVFQTCWRAV